MIADGSKAMNMVSHPNPIYIPEFGLDFQGFLRGRDEKTKRIWFCILAQGEIDKLQTRAGYRV